MYTNVSFLKKAILLASGLAAFVVSIWGVTSVFTAAGQYHKQQQELLSRAQTIPADAGSVLAAEDSLAIKGGVNFNIDTLFYQNLTAKKDVAIEGNLTVSGTVVNPNIIYSITPGAGITLTAGQNPTIINSGVTSLGGKNGEVNLEAGTGISIDGLKISTNGVLTSINAGDGVSVSGNTVTNSDRGSSQNIFKNIAVNGQNTIKAGANDDTFTFVEGAGITLTTDTTNKKLTITSSSAAGGNGVTSLNGLSGILTIAGAGINSVSTSGSTVTISGTEADTLATVTGRGATTATTLNLAAVNASGAITFSGLSTGVLHADANGLLSSSPVNLASSDVTGSVPVSKGGTGLSSFTAGDLVYASATNTLAALGAGGQGSVLSVNAQGLPYWTTLSGGSGGLCTTCLINNPSSTQTVLAAAINAIGLSIKQPLGGTVDVFNVLANNGTYFLNVDSTGKVGIGTSTPQQALDVNGKIATSGTPRIDGSGNLTNIGTVSSTYLVTTGGNVNVSGSANLQIGGTTVINSSRQLANVAGVSTHLTPSANDTYDLGSASNEFNNTYTKNLYLSGNLFSGGSGGGQGAIGFIQRNNGAVSPTNISDDLLLGSIATSSANVKLSGTSGGDSFILGGNIGIGTSSATEKLTVAGNIAPAADLTYDLGSPTLRFRHVYADNISASSSASFSDVIIDGKTNMITDDTNLANGKDTYIYEAKKDADGGKWINSEKVQATSWYNETIDNAGTSCSLSSDDRCGVRSFPQKAVIVATASTIYIYDASENTVWMKIGRGSGYAIDASASINAVHALNGNMFIATSKGVVVFDFIADRIYRYDYNSGSGGRAMFQGNIADRNVNKGYATRQSWGKIASDQVNGVFGRMIDGKLFIAAATVGGASVINVSDQRVVRYINQ